MTPLSSQWWRSARFWGDTRNLKVRKHGGGSKQNTSLRMQDFQVSTKTSRVESGGTPSCQRGLVGGFGTPGMLSFVGGRKAKVGRESQYRNWGYSKGTLLKCDELGGLASLLLMFLSLGKVATLTSWMHSLIEQGDLTFSTSSNQRMLCFHFEYTKHSPKVAFAKGPTSCAHNAEEQLLSTGPGSKQRSLK